MEERLHLPEAELEVMLAVWGAEGSATAPGVLEQLSRPMTAGALHSYLKRLEEKGYLSREKRGKINYYTPLVTKEEYQRREGRSVLEKLYAGSLKRFAASLYDGGALDRTDVEELRAYLDELEGGS